MDTPAIRSQRTLILFIMTNHELNQHLCRRFPPLCDIKEAYLPLYISPIKEAYDHSLLIASIRCLFARDNRLFTVPSETPII